MVTSHFLSYSFSASLCVFLSLSLPISPCLFLYLCIYLCIYLSISLYLYLCVSFLLVLSILLTKTTAAQNDDALSYYTVRGFYFLAVVFVRSISLAHRLLRCSCYNFASGSHASKAIYH